MDNQSAKQDCDDKKAGKSDSQATPSTSNFGNDTQPPFSADGVRYPTLDGTYFSQLYSKPIETTLTSFSQVANFVRNPYELINNVDEFVRQASGNRHKYQRTSDNFIKTLNQNRSSPAPTSPIVQEMDTFVAASPNDHSPASSPQPPTNNQPSQYKDRESISHDTQLPIPALPPIECSTKRGRLEPLTIEEYENQFRKTNSTDLELIERVFFGGIKCNQLRAALWPYLFGLIPHRGKFEKIHNSNGVDAHLFIEHEGNTDRWRELQKLFNLYQNQWKAILPDQESRFSTFRERKSLIERDVIRCDRLHPFYAEEPKNLASLTSLLMTYMMYDFDIGYVQGMSDLAGPILYMYQGNIVKSFWVFVELNCLNELIKNTDPIFAQYLEEHESSNCFFAFRAIVCQFKRELMKEDEDDYSKVLLLWDTIWSAKRREELRSLHNDEMQVDSSRPSNAGSSSGVEKSSKTITEQPVGYSDSAFFMPFDPNQSDSPRHTLTETEIFVLSLCLSMIRRERDIILANKLDGTDIHLHFIDPKLSSDLNGFIEHAINIYSFLKSDFDITLLTSPKEQAPPKGTNNPESPPGSGSAEGYDLLNDFLIINGSSGT